MQALWPVTVLPTPRLLSIDATAPSLTFGPMSSSHGIPPAGQEPRRTVNLDGLPLASPLVVWGRTQNVKTWAAVSSLSFSSCTTDEVAKSRPKPHRAALYAFL